MSQPDTTYARSGETHIAYQVAGDGPLTVLLAMGIPLSMDTFWDAPDPTRFIGRLTAFSRVILFDRRGVGLSDPIDAASPPTIEQWMQDALAVLDDVACEQVAILGSDVIGSQLALLLSASHPNRVSAAVIVNGAARLTHADDYPIGELTAPGPTEQGSTTWLASDEAFEAYWPSAMHDTAKRDWWMRSVRRSASPRVLRMLTDVRDETDVRTILPAVTVPTLVLHRAGNLAYRPAHGRYLAENIASARFVELTGGDQFLFAGAQDELLDELEEFLTGVRPIPEADRVLATILFTDLVDSTATAAALGDARWRAVLDEHEALVRRHLERFRGRYINTTGDGILATFDGPARGVRCAEALRDGVRALGIEMRGGVHTGEIELRANDIGGIAVHIAQRVMVEAAPGEVMVSRTVKDLVGGSGIDFEYRGSHVLKGVPDEWGLFAVIA